MNGGYQVLITINGESVTDGIKAQDACDLIFGRDEAIVTDAVDHEMGLWLVDLPSEVAFMLRTTGFLDAGNDLISITAEWI